jgi:hypothetical protein
MRPAGSDGKKELSSGPVYSRPRLPALIPLTPEPRHGGGHRVIGFDDRSCPDTQATVLPMFVDRTNFQDDRYLDTEAKSVKYSLDMKKLKMIDLMKFFPSPLPALSRRRSLCRVFLNSTSPRL